MVGLARQGKALSRYLCERGANVVITDIKTPSDWHLTTMASTNVTG